MTIRPFRTVLIFAHECAPYHRQQSTVGAQRPAQFAKYLPIAGWRAIVLCCDATRRGAGTAQEFDALPRLVEQQLRNADPQQSIIIATPSWASDGLLDSCWRRLLPTDGRPVSRLRSALRKPLTVAKFVTGDYSQPWQPFARRAAEGVTNQLRVDVVLGEHGPDAGLWLARWFSSRYHVPWVVDFRDPILQPLRPFARRLYAPWARQFVRSAAATINVTPVWTALDEQELRRPAICIPNGFDPEEFDPAPPLPENQKFTIVYAGNIIREQRLEPFLDGLKCLRALVNPSQFSKVRFVYRGAAEAHVIALAADRGVGDVVDAAGYIPRPAAIGLLQRADLLLLLSIADSAARDRYLSRGLYPAKVFEYFGAARPILCVPGDNGLLDALIRDTRTGMICRTPTAVAEYLSAKLREWEAGHPHPYSPDRSAITRFTRRNESLKLASVLDRVTSAEAIVGSTKGPALANDALRATGSRDGECVASSRKKG